MCGKSLVIWAPPACLEDKHWNICTGSWIDSEQCLITLQRQRKVWINTTLRSPTNQCATVKIKLCLSWVVLQSHRMLLWPEVLDITSVCNSFYERQKAQLLLSGRNWISLLQWGYLFYFCVFHFCCKAVIKTIWKCSWLWLLVFT